MVIYSQSTVVQDPAPILTSFNLAEVKVFKENVFFRIFSRCESYNFHWEKFSRSAKKKKSSPQKGIGSLKCSFII